MQTEAEAEPRKPSACVQSAALVTEGARSRTRRHALPNIVLHCVRTMQAETEAGLAGSSVVALVSGVIVSGGENMARSCALVRMGLVCSNV